MKKNLLKTHLGLLSRSDSNTILRRRNCRIAYELIWPGTISYIAVYIYSNWFHSGKSKRIMCNGFIWCIQGTIRDNGFFWVNPFYTKRVISLRARNFNSDPIKVNDKIGTLSK